MTKLYDTLVFVGRMQPFHNGHKAVIDAALENANEVVIVLGSCFQPRTPKNPFTFEERKEMILSCYRSVRDRIQIVGVRDYPYDDNAWVSAVQTAVKEVQAGTKTGLIGHSKDDSSYYLNIFPDWRGHIEVENIDGINATDIREVFFGDSLDPRIDDLMWRKSPFPETVVKFLRKWKASSVDVFDSIVTEAAEIWKYKRAWESAPYAPTFVTTDAVLHQSGSILLVKRKGFPYKNCWALPGGYIETDQSIADNMIKELREETCIKVPAKVLRGSVKAIQVFDKPDRDPRGRTITHAFFIDLGYPNERLPKVQGADDALEAKWVKLSEIKSEMMAFDHYNVIKHFIPTY